MSTLMVLKQIESVALSLGKEFIAENGLKFVLSLIPREHYASVLAALSKLLELSASQSSADPFKGLDISDYEKSMHL